MTAGRGAAGGVRRPRAATPIEGIVPVLKPPGMTSAAVVAVVRRTENLYEYTPMQIKQAVTGYGGADKHQVQHMVKMLLHMDQVARPDDAADALAVAITHANSQHAKEMFRIK